MLSLSHECTAHDIMMLRIMWCVRMRSSIAIVHENKENELQRQNQNAPRNQGGCIMSMAQVPDEHDWLKGDFLWTSWPHTLNGMLVFDLYFAASGLLDTKIRAQWQPADCS